MRGEVNKNGSLDLADVMLEVYNILGKKIITLVDRQLGPGYWSAKWDGRDRKGESVASGLYFYRLQAGEFFTGSKPMLLVR